MPSSGIVGTLTMAAIAQVTDQTILNYRKRGMPCAQEGSGRIGMKWDVQKCLAWIAKNKPVTGTGWGEGGKRPGAGRKPAWKSNKVDLAPVVAGPDGLLVGVDGRPLNDSPLARAVKAAPIVPPEIPDALTAEAMKRLAGGMADEDDMLRLAGCMARAGGITRADAELFDQLSVTNERNRKAREARGELVPASEVRAAWVEKMKTIRTRMMALAGRCSAKVMAAAGSAGIQIPGDKAPVVQAAIAGEIEAFIGELRE